jgi:hypothetical protein
LANTPERDEAISKSPSFQVPENVVDADATPRNGMQRRASSEKQAKTKHRNIVQSALSAIRYVSSAAGSHGGTRGVA